MWERSYSYQSWWWHTRMLWGRHGENKLDGYLLYTILVGSIFCILFKVKYLVNIGMGTIISLKNN